MAANRIDIAVLLRLVTTQLLTLASADLVVLPLGRPAPRSGGAAGGAWCRIKKLSVPTGGPGGGEISAGGIDVKSCTLTVECQVQVDMEHGSSHSIAAIAETVRAAFDQQGFRDATTTHTLTFEDSGAEIEGDEGDQQLILKASVTFSGTAMRQSGETREAYSPSA